MSKSNKILAVLLTLAMLLSLLAACGSPADSSAALEAKERASQGETPAETEGSAPDTQEAVSVPASEVEPDVRPAMELPLTDELVTYSVFANTNPNMDGYDDWNEYPIWKELTARTNVGFDWQLTSMFTASEQYSLLVAANDLPEVVSGDWYTSGVAAAVEEEVYWDVAPYLTEYAPDYYNLIQQDGIRQEIYSDDGYVVCFAEIAEKEFAPNNGIVLRQDLLNEQNLEVPVTYEEYTKVLSALKSAYNMEAPFFMSELNYKVFSAGFEVMDGFSLKGDGGLIYGPASDNYKDYLKQLNQWYEAGLVYQDFYSIPNGEINNYQIEYMSQGKSAAAFMYCEFAGIIEFDDAAAVLAPGYIPRVNADDQIHLTDGIDAQVKVNNGWHISTNCEEDKMKLMCRFLNYLYTEEGATLANYGIEGVTYEVQDDGSKWYTDEIMNNSEMTQTQALLYNLMYMAPCYADYTKYNISTLTTWKDFAEVWGSADNEYNLPTLSLTAAEEETYSAAASDVETYMSEVIIKFMIGDMDIDAEWDRYIATMESLGVNDMIAIYQDAYERYQNK